MFGFSRERLAIPQSTATNLSLERLIDLRAETARTRSSGELGISQLPGLARTRLRGRGLDFDEMRPYAEGDDVRHIDWNVTARTGRPYTRLYREERERAVTVAVDLRPSMFTGSQRLKAVAAGEYAAALLWHVAANQDRAGALVFDGSQIVMSRPATRERGALDAIGTIAKMFEPARAAAVDNALPATLDTVIASINSLSRNAGLIVLLTDCASGGPLLDQELSIAGRRAKLVVMRIADPLELDGLPQGSFAFHHNTKSQNIYLDASSKAALRQDLAARNAALAQRFERHGVPFIVVSSASQPADIWLMLAEREIV